MKYMPTKLSLMVTLSIFSGSILAEDSLSTIIDSTNLSDIGFKLTGDDITLDGNTFTFPSSGHYCAKKSIDVAYKEGEKISLSVDPSEAEKNNISLNIMAWGEGAYKGFSGKTGEAELTSEIPFDAYKISVGFCRYNNSSYDSFEISEFVALHSMEVIPEEIVDVAIPDVYPGCREFYQGLTTKILIVDDSEPRTLQELFDDGTVQPGMSVILRRNEGSLKLTASHTAFSSSDSEWLMVTGEDGATIEDVSLTGVKNIRFRGLKIGSEKEQDFVYTSSTENIIFDSNYISAGDNEETWDIEKWQNIGNGIKFDRSSCSTAYNNELENLRFGVTVYTYDSEMRPEIQSQKALIKDNLIKNISADFIRPIGSDITIDGNVGLDHFASEDDGDSNHDDFIQGFAYPLGTEFDNVKIVNNYYQSSTDLARSWQSQGQGIVVFDGLYTNFEISNNTIISDHWHGITIYWGKNGVIKNNTVMVLDDTSGKYMWIQNKSDKSGEHAPENVQVVNNVSNSLSLETATLERSENNVVISRTEVANNLIEYNPYDMSYDVSVKVDSPYYLEGTGSEVTSLIKAIK